MLWGHKHNNNKGFSLIEMAVVLTSVTAIIAMTIVGVSLINKTKTSGIINDINKFKEAVVSFQKKHGALPGDIADVSSISGASGSEGNGNGAIDTDSEAINVWYHLSKVGLIDGNYDGSSENTSGIGVPASKIEGSGYNIKRASLVTARGVSDQAFIIELAGLNGNVNDLPTITASDAKTIDEKIDDGHPLKGKVLAEGLNNDCVNASGEYNLLEDVASCRLLFIVDGDSSSDAPNVTGACNEIGQTRQSTDYNNSCPEGYEGIIVETCRISSDNIGTWEITDRNCVEVKCADGSSAGDTRKLSCINGMKGVEGIVEQCTNNGIWKVIRSDCEHPAGIPCRTENDTRKAQACDWGEAGFMLQTCTNNKWDVPASGTNNTCGSIQCGSSNIGDSNIASNCGANYTGDSIEICTIAGSWEETSIGSKCAPILGTCNSLSDTTKDIGCSAGKEGEHIVKCIANAGGDYWTTIKNSCEPIQCSGRKNIGAVRVKEGARCPNDSNGKVMEYCDETGTWQEVINNCAQGICEAAKDGKGNAKWPTSIGGTVANYTSCIPGYIEDPSNNPTRECNSDGTWGAISDPCIRNTCPLTFVNSTITTDDDATYPITFAGDSDVKGTCDPLFATGAPIADCDIDGNWENERLPCQPLSLCNITDTLPISGVGLWLDANHECTVLASECDNPSVVADDGDDVSCWKDKSGNNNHAEVYAPLYNHHPTYIHGAINGKNVLDIPYHSNNDSGYNMTISAGSTISDANDNLTMFMVLSPNIRGSYGLPGYYFYKSGTPDIGFFLTSSSAGGLKIRSDYSSTTVLQPDNFIYGQTYVYTYKTDGSDLYYYIDGVEVGNAAITPVSSPSGTWRIGGFSNYRAENIIYESTLTDTQTKSIELYLGSKWGVDVLNVSVPQRVWLDAEDEGTIYSDTLCTTNAVVDVDLVRCWADKSGNGHDAVLTLSDAYAPSLVSSGMNERVSLAFDDDRLDFDVVGDLITSSGGEGFIAFYSNPGVDNAGLWQASRKNNSHATTLSLYSNGNVKMYSSFALLANEGVSYTFSTSGNKQGTNMLYNPVSVSGEWSLRFNGELEYTKVSNPGINYTSKQFIGRGRDNNDVYYALEGYMGEVMTYDGKLSDTERDYVELYLSDKWGIEIP